MEGTNIYGNTLPTRSATGGVAEGGGIGNGGPTSERMRWNLMGAKGWEREVDRCWVTNYQFSMREEDNFLYVQRVNMNRNC
jgi:hypothetical protein